MKAERKVEVKGRAPAVFMLWKIFPSWLARARHESTADQSEHSNWV